MVSRPPYIDRLTVRTDAMKSQSDNTAPSPTPRDDEMLVMNHHCLKEQNSTKTKAVTIHI